MFCCCRLRLRCLPPPPPPPPSPPLLSPLPPLPPFTTVARSLSPEAELTETLQKFSEVIPIVSETHSVSLEYASLVRYSYYIPRQY
jgi:hypothetical protein